MSRRAPTLRRRAPTLRRRLVLGVVTVLAIGVVAFAAATYVALRAFLNHRTDSDALATAHAAADTVRASVVQLRTVQVPALQGALALTLPPGGAAELRIKASHQTIEVAAGPAHQVVDGAEVPSLRMLKSLRVPDFDHGSYSGAFAVKAGRVPYRVVAVRFRRLGSLLVGIPTTDNVSTLHRLLLIETSTAIGLLLVLALVALGVVRRGLRPLDVIAATATAITAGERGRRIPFASSESEVGRVSEALNRMLDENESALAAKEASEERMRRFVADASHELRTPLASIRSYADLLASGAAATPADRSLALERIQAEAVRMTRLVEDLLLLARLDMGRPLARGPVDVASIARAAVADFGAIDPSRRVTLEAAAGAVVDGDRDRLHQVLANLLANARQHTPPGTRVEVRVDAAADEVVVQVRDHGPGLPDEQAVFDPFYRADPARRRHGSVGVGLGLPIVAAIVRAHGGTVTARNEPSGGAVFVVRLPVDRQPAAERVPAAEPVPVASG